MLDAVGLCKSYGAQELLGGVGFKIVPGERLALVGPNGSGKTTILRILAGEESPDRGEVHCRRGIDIGYLPQELDVSSAVPLVAFVEDVADDVRRVEAELREIEGQLSRAPAEAGLLDRYGHLQTRFEHLGGYQLRSRAERILAGLGFREADHERPLREFSGGWRMRAALARILLREPDLVLLDEPTNHLDLPSLEWLEIHLVESPSAFLVVSHDVSFLDRVVTGVLALEGGKLVRTRGGYTRYQEERRARQEQARAAWDNYQKKRAATEAFAERFRYKATKARQVQSRLRLLDKSPAPPAQPAPEAAAPKLVLPPAPRSGRIVAELQGVAAGYGGPPVWEGLDFRLERGEKVALVGPNGAGKSTLLKVLAGVLRPTAGAVTYGHNVTLSYFAQHQLEQLDPQRTALEEMLSLPGLRTELEMRSILGGFLFSGDAVDKPVAVLSGGEKSRLVLAKLLADPGNLFLLDEPTNHLDLRSCGVLKDALRDFQGALCVITHDRDLINRVATRVVYVEGGSCRSYLGNFDDYLRKRAAEEALAEETAGARPRGDLARGAGKRERRRQEAERRERLRRQTGPLRARVAELEEEVAALETALEATEAALADPQVYADGARVAALGRERAQGAARLEEVSAAWERAATELEALEARLAREGTEP